MHTSDHTIPAAPWLPFLGAALRLRRHELKLRSVDVNQRLLAQGGRVCNVLRYEGPVVQSDFGPVACKATYTDPGIVMMVRLAAALNWTVADWLTAAEDLRIRHEAALARAEREHGLTREALLAGLKAGQWRSRT